MCFQCTSQLTALKDKLFQTPARQNKSYADMNYVPEHFILLKLCFCIPLPRHIPSTADKPHSTLKKGMQQQLCYLNVKISRLVGLSFQQGAFNFRNVKLLENPFYSNREIKYSFMYNNIWCFGSSKLQLIKTYFNGSNIPQNEVYYIQMQTPGIRTNIFPKIVIFKQL